MKILQIVAAYKPSYIYGGPTMSVSMLSEQLNAACITADAYTTTANGTHELPFAPGTVMNVDGVRTTYFKRLTKDHTHFSPALLKTVWKNARNYDLIHIHAWWNLVSVLSCFIALLRKVPVVVSPRGTLSSYSFSARHNRLKYLFHRLIGIRLLNRCHFHVTSVQEEQDVAALLQPKSITVLPNFVALPATPSSAVQSTNCFRLLFLSRIDPKKGLNLLIEALPHLHFPFHLTVAGSGEASYLSYLKELAEANQVGQHITWAGFQGEKKFKLIAAHQLLVLPSYNENFGNVVIESLSEGTAVLVSTGVGLAQYVTANHLGWACSAQAESIADSLNTIHTQQHDLLRIRQQAPALIRQDYSVPRLVAQYVQLYRKTISR